jgi:hypothetical protein
MINWKTLFTPLVAILTAVLSCSAGSAQDLSANSFLINNNSYYPEGPLAIGNGVLYAEMPRHRIMRWSVWANVNFSLCKWVSGDLPSCR